ncbi:MAG: phosphocholine cytidylyltransferase family protein [Sphingobacteriia bacterium]|nr:phosphocholine cytidylyltransferase family protein [Sphingobacteriia bacterium]
MKNIKFVLLAAGRGSRVNSLSDNKPKSMTEINGRSLIQSQLDIIKSFTNEIAVVTGYRDEVLYEHLKEYNIEFFHNSNWADSNIISSLLCAEKWFQGSEVVVCYTDILYSREALSTLLTAERNITIPYYTKWLELWTKRFSNPLEYLETFKINDRGELTEIGNKTDNINNIQGQFMGIMKFSPNGWLQVRNFLNNFTEQVISTLDSTKLLNKLVQDGITVNTVGISDFWFEIDTEYDYDLYHKLELTLN